MILCHKCDGLLEHGKKEDRTGLRGCACISGYVRDFQKPINRQAAIRLQVKAASSSITLYLGQGRDLNEPVYEWAMEELTTLFSL